jgi:hypothetical protein
LLTVEVHALPAQRLPNGFDALLDLVRPLVKLLLSSLFAEVCRSGELGLEPRAIQASVFFTHVVGKPLARAIIAPAVLT